MSITPIATTAATSASSSSSSNSMPSTSLTDSIKSRKYNGEELFKDILVDDEVKIILEMKGMRDVKRQRQYIQSHERIMYLKMFNTFKIILENKYKDKFKNNRQINHEAKNFVVSYFKLQGICINLDQFTRWIKADQRNKKLMPRGVRIQKEFEKDLWGRLILVVYDNTKTGCANG
jgi:hypothetical protein